MSFLSVLGKIGKFALPFIPGVGPIASKVVDGVTGGLGIAGDIAEGESKKRAENRGAQGLYDMARVPTQNAQQLQYAQARQGADQARMGQIAVADTLGNMKQPTDPRAKFGNGGQINPETLQMMRSRAMQALESGSDVPQMQQLPAEPGGGGTGMDSFLSALSLGGTAAGALRESGMFNKPQPTPGQSGPINLPNIPQVGALGEDDRPWWLKQAPPTMRGN